MMMLMIMIMLITMLMIMMGMPRNKDEAEYTMETWSDRHHSWKARSVYWGAICARLHLSFTVPLIGIDVPPWHYQMGPGPRPDGDGCFYFVVIALVFTALF